MTTIFSLGLKAAGVLGVSAGLVLAGCGPTGTGGTGGVGGTGGSGGSGGGPAGTCPVPSHSTASYTGGWATSSAFVGGTMYYPTNMSGSFGGIVIVPGYLSPVSLMASWGPFLASRGMAAFLVDPPSSGDFPAARSSAQLAALNSLKGENTRSGSPLQGKLNLDALAIAGWSMGGGGTLHSANSNPPGVKAAVAFAPWETATSFPSDRVPTLILAGGSADSLVSHQMSRAEYDSIPGSTPKAYAEISGADHFQWTSPSGAGSRAGTFTWAWVNAYVNGETGCKSVISQAGGGFADFATSSL